MQTQSSLQSRKQPFIGRTGEKQKTRVQKTQKVQTLKSPGLGVQRECSKIWQIISLNI